VNKIQIKRNNTLRKFDYISRGHVGCIRFSHGESPEHRKLKIKICEYYFDLGMEFLTEAKVLDKPFIADVVILDIEKILEIKVSESRKSIDRKKKICQRLGLNFEVERKKSVKDLG